MHIFRPFFFDIHPSLRASVVITITITIQFDCFEAGNIFVFGEAFLGVSSLTSWFGRRFASRRFRARLLNLVRCPKAPSWNNSLSAFKLFRKLFKLRQRFFVFCRQCSTRLKTPLHHLSQLPTFHFWEKADAILFISQFSYSRMITISWNTFDRTENTLYLHVTTLYTRPTYRRLSPLSSVPFPTIEGTGRRGRMKFKCHV